MLRSRKSPIVSGLITLFALSVSALPSADAQSGWFIRGDANSDGVLSIADVLAVSQFILFGAAAPQCPDSADVNDDGALNIADPLFLISYLFGPGTSFSIPAPNPDPGPDPTTDNIVCSGPLGSEPSGSELPHVFFFFSEDPDSGNEDFAIAPGSDFVSIPIRMTAESPFGVEGLAISLSFDPAIVAEAVIDFSEGVPDQHNADLQISHVSEFLPGRVYGYIVMELVSPFSEPEFPVGENQLLGHLILRLHDNVAPNTSFEINFSTLPPQPGTPPIRNEIVKGGGVGVLYPYTYPMTVNVRPEGDIFIRGDMNRDGVVNSIDGFQLVSYMFTGFNLTPPCLDAADVDDSGSIDLADAIVLLNTVFNSNSSFRPATPYPYQGVDATDDSINCLE